MDRRKAIISIACGGGVLLTALGGYKWMRPYRTPDLAYLEAQEALLGDLAEIIIPATDAPGARAAGVGPFIIRMVADVCDRKSQNNFIDGLKELQAYTARACKRPFSTLEASRQAEILSRFREEGNPYTGRIGKMESHLWGKSFFTILREATIIGYCRSRQGATHLLAYDWIPGRYEGCISITRKQRAWATL
ncbi:MAG: gluconate 2-dehydrogenase subunit 3 family protein [Bacteroidetes bacterium]|nr:gluconate 2-dehydrogenase subunit 3 family protein [Bacteroidota bacterium]